MILFVFAVVQFAIFGFGKSIATGSAESAAQAAALEDATDADAIAAAYDMIEAGGTTLSSPKVTVTRSATNVNVTVTGQVTSVIPLVHSLPVSQTVSYPIERTSRP